MGEVRVACPDFVSAGLLPAAIEKLARRSSNYFVKVVQLNTSSLEFRDLHERNVDLALARVPTTFADDDLNVEILFDDLHYIVAGLQSRWARRRSIKLAELVDEPWVLPSSPVIDNVLKAAFESRRLKGPLVAVSALSIPLRNQLLATGRYLSVLAISVLQSNAKQWSLKALPIDISLTPPPVAIITLRNRTIRPVVQRFIEDLRTVAKTMTPAVGTRRG